MFIRRRGCGIRELRRQLINLWILVVLLGPLPDSCPVASTQDSDCGTAVVRELEPNNTVATAQGVNIPVTIQGHAAESDPGGDLRGADDIEDLYKFRVPAPPAGSAGTLVSITTSFDSGDIDVYLFRAKDDGTVAGSDLFDASALVSNPEVIGPRCLPAGVYYLGVSEFDEAPLTNESDYSVRICVGGNLQVAASDNGFASLTSRYVPPSADNLLLVNCLSPCRYPATVLSGRLLFFRFRGLPDPTGQPITLVFFKGPAPGPGGTSVPPAKPQITRVEDSVEGLELYFDVSLPEGQRLTLSPGEVLYVGLEIRRQLPGVFPTIEFSPTSNNCSFLSTDGGASWSRLPVSNDDTRHFVFRAILELK